MDYKIYIFKIALFQLNLYSLNWQILVISTFWSAKRTYCRIRLSLNCYCLLTSTNIVWSIKYPLMKSEVIGQDFPLRKACRVTKWDRFWAKRTKWDTVPVQGFRMLPFKVVSTRLDWLRYLSGEGHWTGWLRNRLDWAKTG